MYICGLNTEQIFPDITQQAQLLKVIGHTLTNLKNQIIISLNKLISKSNILSFQVNEYKFTFHYCNCHNIIVCLFVDMNNQNSDISYNSSDEQSQDFRPAQMNMFQMNVQANETVDSMKQMFTQDNQDQSFNQASLLFSKFYNSELIRKKKPYYDFSKSPVFDGYVSSFEVYYPKPNLYFLPITILFNRKIEKLIDLRDKIVQQLGNKGNVQIPREKSEEIFVTLHDRNQMNSYVIRSNSLISKYNHQNPELLDQVLCLGPLFEFYQKTFQKSKFSQTCGIFMYWAYLNRILGPDYLSETSIKIIVIVYYLISESAPNIITQYKKQNEKELDQLQKLYRINKKMECELFPQIFNKVNFSLMEKRSFYNESQRKYTMMTKILPIPYPASQQDINKYCQSYKSKQSTNSRGHSKSHYALVKFFKIMQYLQNCIKRSEKVIFDVTTRKGVISSGDCEFKIEVKHPIFGNNLCEKLMNDSSKLRILKQQIGNVALIYKKSKERSLEALTKVFERN